MYDSYARDIDYLRVSVTDRCNLRCVYCVPAQPVPPLPKEDILSFEAIVAVCRAAAELGFRKFRLTGGEPLARADFPVLVRLLREALPDAELAMTTNGTLLAPLAGALKAAGLDSANVSLDTLDEERYAELTRGGRLADARAGAEAAAAAGLRTKLNVVVRPDTTDAELDALRAYAARIGAAVQLIREYRLDEAKRDGGPYDRPPRCGLCNRLRLSADGKLKACLHSDAETPLDFTDLRASLERCVRSKPRSGGSRAVHDLKGIGG